jgi:hypothetical protein
LKLRERVVAVDKPGDCGMSKGLTIKAPKLISKALRSGLQTDKSNSNLSKSNQIYPNQIKSNQIGVNTIQIKSNCNAQIYLDI